MEAAAKWVKSHASVRRVVIVSSDEIELAGAVGHSDMTHHEPRLRLRLGKGGELHLTTECTCHSGSLCDHAATLMLLCEQDAARAQMERIARPGSASVGEEKASAVAEAADDAVQMDNESPRPILRLRRLVVERPQLKIGRGGVTQVPVSIGVAEPWVRYDGCPERFPLLVRGGGARWRGEDGKSYALSRNIKMERLLQADLIETGLLPVTQAIPDARAPSGAQACLSWSEKDQALNWSRFVRDHVPWLRSSGWEVETAEDFGFTLHEAPEEAWFTRLEPETPGAESFSLDLGIELDGARISLVPLLVECIDRGLDLATLEADPEQKLLIALPGEGNPVLAVPAHRLIHLLRFLHELMSNRKARKDGKVQIDKLRAAQLAGLDGLPIRVPEELAALRRRLEGFKEMTMVEPPAGLKASLRPYQREGLSWLQFLREFGLHGVLADDMGLGKTMQTLSHLLLEKEAGRMDRPCLIIAPTSVIRNWAREAAKFAPDLRVLLLHGDERHSDFRRIPKHDLVITSYPLLVRDAEPLQAVDWHVAALDEAQHVKNPRSKAALVAAGLRARHRLCITGTPMENHLGELWSLFQFLMPGILGDADNFREYYRNPIEKEQDAARQEQLAARLQPLMLRRTKSAVAKDLPPKTEILHTIELGKAQTDLYETIRAAVDQRVKEAISAQGLERSQIIVLDALLKLRQVCCNPRLLKLEAAQGIAESAKTDYLMEDLLPELIEEGHRVLIFSQFTEMLGIISAKLKEAGIQHVKLTGDTQDRDTPVQRFQRGEVPVFLISLKAGGSGLTLTAADTVIHYDPWWNPAAEAQASDRAHRIGQTKPVFIHKLICQGTIEERIVDMQKSKAALIEGLLTGRSENLKLTQEDLQRLLDA